MSGTGRFIALEGIDGCGKTTQARVLAEACGAVLTFEPGATALGASVRQLILGAGDGGSGPVPRAELLLLAADRAQHVEETIRPALDAGRWVVTDRFSGSTLAYQGKGRGLAIDEIASVSDWAAGGLGPDLTVVLDVPVSTAVRRRTGEVGDRLERLGTTFQEAVRRGYLELAEERSDRWVVIDGARDVAAVAADVAAAAREHLGAWPSDGRAGLGRWEGSP